MRTKSTSPATSRWKRPKCQTEQSQITSVPAICSTDPLSCLAAGTPILTDAGPVAVEKIKVGDRVLSQDAETGELAYKPVLHTTVRLNAELVKLELFDGTITCSVGTVSGFPARAG